MTHRVSHFIWQSFLRVSRISERPQLLKSAGISVILTLIVMWLGLLWLGLFLVLLGDYDSVVTSSKSLPASALDKLYYSGYVLSTLGNGDFKPGSRVAIGYGGLFVRGFHLYHYRYDVRDLGGFSHY